MDGVMAVVLRALEYYSSCRSKVFTLTGSRIRRVSRIPTSYLLTAYSILEECFSDAIVAKLRLQSNTTYVMHRDAVKYLLKGVKPPKHVIEEVKLLMKVLRRREAERVCAQPLNRRCLGARMFSMKFSVTPHL